MRTRTISAVGGGAAVLALCLYPGPSSAGDTQQAPTCFGEEATLVVDEPDEVVHGTKGRDVIVVLESATQTTVHAGDGDDLLCGRAGELHGGPGDDVSENFGEGANCVFGGRGDDTHQGRGGHDCFDGGPGDDVMFGRAGPDYFFPGPGHDRFAGGAGDDDILPVGHGAKRVDLPEGIAKGPGTTRFSSVEGAKVRGPGRKVVIGTAADNTITAWGEGRNRLVGRGGDDQIYGGKHSDVIHGGPGDDLLNGGPGEDTVRGGRGDDRLEHHYAASDRMFGGPGADRLQGWRKGRGDRLYGGPGPDRLFGGRGDDFLYGGKGEDVGNGRKGTDLCRSLERQQQCEH